MFGTLKQEDHRKASLNYREVQGQPESHREILSQEQGGRGGGGGGRKKKKKRNRSEDLYLI